MYSELEKLNHPEICYGFLCYKMRLFHEKLDKVTLFRKHNNRGRLISQIVAYTHDSNDTVRTQIFRLYDDDYIWLLNAITEDFPDVPFEDLSDEKDKLVKHNAE